jgi:hypothetical protein
LKYLAANGKLIKVIMFQDCAVMVTYSTLVIAMLAIKWRRILNAVNSNVSCIILFVTSNAIFGSELNI